jgi:hypothetical protein
MLGVVYVSYAVALVYGAHRVAAGAYTGGMVLNVIMATIMGGFSLGMVRRMGSFRWSSTGQGRAMG